MQQKREKQKEDRRMPKCICCSKTKPRRAFQKDHRNRSGLSSFCKDCHSNAVHESRKKYPDAARKIQRKYRKRQQEKER